MDQKTNYPRVARKTSKKYTHTYTHTWKTIFIVLFRSSSFRQSNTPYLNQCWLLMVFWLLACRDKTKTFYVIFSFYYYYYYLFGRCRTGPSYYGQVVINYHPDKAGLIRVELIFVSRLMRHVIALGKPFGKSLRGNHSSGAFVGRALHK